MLKYGIYLSTLCFLINSSPTILSMEDLKKLFESGNWRIENVLLLALFLKYLTRIDNQRVKQNLRTRTRELFLLTNYFNGKMYESKREDD